MSAASSNMESFFARFIPHTITISVAKEEGDPIDQRLIEVAKENFASTREVAPDQVDLVVITDSDALQTCNKLIKALEENRFHILRSLMTPMEDERTKNYRREIEKDKQAQKQEQRRSRLFYALQRQPYPEAIREAIGKCTTKILADWSEESIYDFLQGEKSYDLSPTADSIVEEILKELDPSFPL